MSTPSKIQWIEGVILAGILITLGFIGGDWGTDYTASAAVNANPTITAVLPTTVPAQHHDKVIVVIGSVFGDKNNTGVRLVGNGIDVILHPLDIYPVALSVNIPSTYLTTPTVYTLTVVRSDYNTIPTIPLEPIWDRESNAFTFTVLPVIHTYLPIIRLTP